MPISKGFDVRVYCGGKQMKEYKVEEEQDEKTETLTVSAWIASEAGKPFTISWKELVPKTNMRVLVIVDGHLANDCMHAKDHAAGISRGVETDDGRLRRFRFDSIKLTEHWQKSKYQSSEEMGYTSARGDLDDPPVLHETDVKAGGHNACFDDPARNGTLGDEIFLPVGEDLHPMVSFHFRYRPKVILEKNGIIPQRTRTDNDKGSKPATSMTGPSTRSRRRPASPGPADLGVPARQPKRRRQLEDAKVAPQAEAEDGPLAAGAAGAPQSNQSPQSRSPTLQYIDVPIRDQTDAVKREDGTPILVADGMVGIETEASQAHSGAIPRSPTLDYIDIPVCVRLNMLKREDGVPDLATVDTIGEGEQKRPIEFPPGPSQIRTEPGGGAVAVSDGGERKLIKADPEFQEKLAAYNVAKAEYEQRRRDLQALMKLEEHEICVPVNGEVIDLT